MALDYRQELGGTFDTAVSLYEKMRPGYVDELYKAIFDYVSIDENSSVVEVGSGSGQATLPILKTGCSLTAVEYGENFSTLLKDKFKEFSKFKVLTGKFEDVELEKDTYDLVFSATAFHWVPEEIGYPKVYSMLKEGGAFARFANRPRNSKNDPELAEEIDAIYEEYYNKFYGIRSGSKTIFTEDTAREISQIPAKYGFTDITYHLFHRERVFTAKEYIQLLGTYSDHIAIEESIRKVFFAKIEDAIHRHGGSITISDTLDLELARKPRR
ncbi:MAG: class I SAM-dependent methyltransferase [Saccharofermentanaceae bacterium]|nr:class I SAM-dependent methyltransferase [Saccharofermentanaceae bacterium]